jgi:cysteine synthase
VPDVLKKELIDEIVDITNENAGIMVHRMATEKGILAGISSGASVGAAVEVARRSENRRKIVVVIIPDTGERHLRAGFSKSPLRSLLQFGKIN